MVIRAVVAEDSYLIREGMRMLLATQSDIELVATATSLPQLLDAVAAHGPDVVVTDIRMPPHDRDEGIQAAETLARTHPNLGVVVLSNYVEPDWALRLFESAPAGRAYLLKERVGDLDQIRQAIDTVIAGGSVLDPLVVEALVRSRGRRAESPLARLTAREAEVLELVATGLSNAAIAGKLTLTERTVEKHITAIMDKLSLDAGDAEIHRRVRAVLYYLSSTSA
jgi:DNA-binding NarL/FixJ family response regulator